MAFKNGDKYDGEWANEVFHGTGTYLYADGTVFTGNWVEGVYTL